MHPNNSPLQDRPHPPLTTLAQGDQVLLKTLTPNLTLQPQWTGPFMVILTTPTAAKLLGHELWYHITRLKWAPSHGLLPPQSTNTHTYTSKVSGSARFTITKISLPPIGE
uniref:Murine leukemia virus integrase C-terminal domain-containing protein n=1 Tax=Moschus moschiferus TaxID=68415 RepID=A0A8C6EB25_MOSMO